MKHKTSRWRRGVGAYMTETWGDVLGAMGKGQSRQQTVSSANGRKKGTE